MKKYKNKKSLVALLLVAVLGIVGVTIAYFTSTDTFTNVFRTQPYRMEVTEVFESPSNWVPGTTTSKVVYANNTGNVGAAVRVSYTESWKDALNQNLPLKDDQNRNAAILNFPSNFSENWVKSTESGVDYYYYKTEVAAGASTTNFLESVTFNPNVTISTDHDCTTVGSTTTCTTATGGYAGGTYTLTITVETVQYDQYGTAWSTSVNISRSGSGSGE